MNTNKTNAIFTKTTNGRHVTKLFSSCSGKDDISGERGQYCCIPECGNYRSEKYRNKTHIGLITFIQKKKKSRAAS